MDKMELVGRPRLGSPSSALLTLTVVPRIAVRNDAVSLACAGMRCPRVEEWERTSPAMTRQRLTRRGAAKENNNLKCIIARAIYPGNTTVGQTQDDLA